MRRLQVMGCRNDTVKQALAVDGPVGAVSADAARSIVDAVQPRSGSCHGWHPGPTTSAMSSSVYVDRRRPQPSQ